MDKIFITLIATLGLIGLASTAQAACSGHLETATTDSATVATDTTTTTKPILQEQSGG